MTNRMREIDWSQFELKFDEKENPTIILKRTKKPLPVHLLNDRYLAFCTRETNNVLYHRAIYFLNEIQNGREPDFNMEIHHINEDKLDNRLANLEPITSHEHRARHKILEKAHIGLLNKWKNDPEFRARMTENLKRARAIKTEKYRARKAAEQNGQNQE